MERNNLFMKAYISFIFIAMFLRLRFSYPLWSPLVMAITLSSVLFSIEDLYASFARAQGNLCDIKDDFTSTALKRAEKALSFHEKISNDLTLFENMGYDTSNLQKTVEHAKRQLTEMMQKLSSIEHESAYARKKQDEFQNKANFFTYAGFLILFCTLILTSMFTITTIVQDFFTVLSFSVILITHQINTDKSLKITEYMEKSKEILQDLEEVEKGVSNMEKDHDAIIALVESPLDKSKEEQSHAD